MNLMEEKTMAMAMAMEEKTFFHEKNMEREL